MIVKVTVRVRSEAQLLSLTDGAILAPQTILNLKKLKINQILIK